MGYSADKSPLIGHLAGPIRRLEPLGAQRQEKGGPNHLTREGLHATTPRIDTALNKSTGRLWVVKEDFGVSRVEFEMDEPVRFWGGIVGVLRNTVGRLEFTRTAEGAWLRETIDIRLDLRIVFWNLRRRIVRQWTEYTPIPATDQ